MSTPRLGPFQLLEPLGSGAMGDVWRGVHAPSGTPVAVKTMAGSEPALREAFDREVRAVAALDHPGIVWVFDSGVVSAEASRHADGRLTEGHPYLVMELVPGGTLDRRAVPGWPTARVLLLGLLDALAHAHARGVVHRDLKPANILRSAERWDGPGAWKIVDFGISRAIGVGAGVEQGTVGTLHYMAPEQGAARWRDQGPWTDLYGLGCVAWWLVSGRRPFEGRHGLELLRAHASAEPPPFTPTMPVPAGLEGWLRVLLAKHPGDRYASAADAAAALLELGGAVDAIVADDDDDEVDFGAATLALPEPSHLPEATLGGLAPRRRRVVPVAWRQRTPAPRPMGLVGAGTALYGLRAVPLVGRESERDRLWAALRDVAERGAPGLVQVVGPSGVGVTHLGRWLCERALEVGAAAVIPVLGGDVRGALAAWAVAEGLDGQSRWWRVRTVVEREAGRDDELTERVATLLDPASELTVAARDATVRRLVERCAARGPVVLWLDDPDEDAAALARHVVEAGRGPVLVLVTAREALLPGAPLLLGPLPPGAHRHLVRDLLRLDEELAARVAVHTRESPRFAVELVGSWVQRGRLAPSTSGFVLADGDASAFVLPPSVESVWAERIEALARELAGGRRALELAAASGLEVDAATWRAAVCDDAVCDALLGRLVVLRLAVAGHGRWRFTQPLFREAVLGAARDGGRWRALHARIAEALGEGADPRRLGHHLLAAGRAEAAWPLLWEAAKEMDYRVGHGAAIDLLADCEASLDALGVPEVDARRARLWARRASLFNGSGAPGQAEALARRAEALAREHGWSEVLAHALKVRAAIALYRRDPAGEQHCVEALAYTTGAKERANIVFNLAIFARHRGDAEAALRHAEEGVALAEQSGVPHTVADAGKLLGLTALHVGDAERATRWLEQVLPHYRSVGNDYALGDCLNALAMIAQGRGDPDGGEGLLRAAIDAFEAAGSVQVVYPQLNLALHQLGRGDPALARASLLPARDRIIRAERPALLAVAEVALAGCAAALGEPGAFDAHADVVERLLRERPVREPELRGVLSAAADTLDRAGDPLRAHRARVLADLVQH